MRYLIILTILSLISTGCSKDVKPNSLDYCEISEKPILPKRITVEDGDKTYRCSSANENIDMSIRHSAEQCMSKDVEDYLYRQAENWVRLCYKK